MSLQSLEMKCVPLKTSSPRMMQSCCMLRTASPPGGPAHQSDHSLTCQIGSSPDESVDTIGRAGQRPSHSISEKSGAVGVNLTVRFNADHKLGWRGRSQRLEWGGPASKLSSPRHISVPPSRVRTAAPRKPPFRLSRAWGSGELCGEFGLGVRIHKLAGGGSGSSLPMVDTTVPARRRARNTSKQSP